MEEHKGKGEYSSQVKMNVFGYLNISWAILNLAMIKV